MTRHGSAAIVGIALSFVLAGAVTAHVETKSVMTEAGECTSDVDPNCGGAAIYGPDGFTGTFTFASDAAGESLTLVDYICVHSPGGSSFTTFGGTYTLQVSDGGVPLASATYSVTGGLTCSGSSPQGVAASSGAAIVVPADLTVEYAVSIDGVEPGADAQATFAAYNSIRNEVFDTSGGVARAGSMKPPTDFVIAEAPGAILLLGSGVALAAAWVLRSQRRRGQLAA